MSYREKLTAEEYPLRIYNNTTSASQQKRSSLKGPTRVLKLCLLGILLPALLTATPLYMRYHVYNHQLYPLAMSDMRLLDNKVSTTWCQRQLVKVNTTFNAFLMKQSPTVSPLLKPLSMVRHLILEDDTKEYWGFYLLKGSSVTVSTCVRWPGASLIVIRGHKHLHECAYIGDNSSEELDELMEAIREGTYVASEDQSNVSPVNQPNMMKRHRVDVEFHNPEHKNSTKIESSSDTAEVTDVKEMQTILDAIQKKTNKSRKNPAAAEMHHVHRNSTIAKGETGNLKIAAPNETTKSQETLDDILTKLRGLGDAKGSDVLRELNKKFNNTIEKQSNGTEVEQKIDMKGRHYSKPAVEFDDNIDKARRRRRRRDIVISNAFDAQFNKDDDEKNSAIEEGFSPDGIADHRGTVNETTLNDMSNSEFWSSFSSSEEALLNCDGLILNLPLTPHHKCSTGLSENEAEETYLANTITYKVPENGYYFFVFNSENEVQPNYIRVQFHLKKAVYNVSEAVSSCMNSSEACAMELKFFSSQKLVMELPVRENDSLWNEEFVVMSECEPRTAVYLFCVIAVPVLVVLFAFS